MGYIACEWAGATGSGELPDSARRFRTAAEIQGCPNLS
jgi:hypothetical protein